LLGGGGRDAFPLPRRLGTTTLTKAPLQRKLLQPCYADAGGSRRPRLQEQERDKRAQAKAG
jgi:hypothetical protein